MKKGKRILAAAVALCMVFGTTSVLPENVTAKIGFTVKASAETWGDFGYSIDEDYDGTYYATITDYSGSAANLTIPSKIGEYDVRRIEYEAFENCTSLKSVTIPDSVTSIYSGAFYNCTNLESVTLPANITYIGYDTFCNCTSLKSISIPENVTHIDNYAFQNCTSLTSVSLPSTLRQICRCAFIGCTSLKELTVPNRVTNIEEYAFGFSSEEYDYETDTYIVEKISGFKVKCGSGSTAEQFAVDNGLTYQTVAMPKFTYYLDGDGDLIIDTYTGKDTVVNIPSEIDGMPVKEIESGTFYNNPYVQTVNIPATVNSLNTEFYGCTSLMNINVDPENENYASYDGVLYSNDLSSLYRCPQNRTSITFSDKTDYISVSAFEDCTKLTTVNIPEGVTYIASYAFKNCSALTSVTLPSSLLNINSNAFIGCTSLKEITVPNSVKYIDDFALGYVSEWWDEWQDKEVGEKVKGFKIICGEGSAAEKYADKNGFTKQLVAMPKFSYTVNENNGTLCVTSYTGKDTVVDIPSQIDGKTVTEIDSEIFVNNSTVQSVNIPSTVDDISSGAFDNCPTLLNINADPANRDYSSYDGVLYTDNMTTLFICPEGKSSVKFAETTDYIKNYAFADCTKLKSITVPEGITDINNNTFENCTALTSVNLPESLRYIDSEAFKDCTSLKSVVLPSYIRNIGYCAFSGCTSLKSVVLPSYIRNIGYCAFSGCTSLKEITIPNSVREIDEGAFGYKYYYGFDSNEKVSGFKIICGEGSAAEKYADENGFAKQLVAMSKFSYSLDSDNNTLTVTFYSGKDTSVVIPSEADGKKVAGIDSRAFSDNSTLQTVTVPAGITYISTEAFYNCKALTNINVNANNENYSSVNGVLYNKDKTELLSCPAKKTSVTIPDTVTNIDAYAFSGCTGIKSITLPKELSYLDSDCFSGCTSLQSITIPEKVTYINNNAFYGCTSLQSITIPEKVTYINDNAFYGCTSLSSVTLSKNLHSLSSDAFSNCPALKTVTVPNSVTYFGDHCLGYTYDADTDEYTKISGFKIKCGEYSDAQKYAEDNGIAYELVDLPKFSYTDYGDGTLYISKYTGRDENITIPSTIDGKKVSGISSNIFSDNTFVKNVVISKGIASIDNSAFCGCTNLSSVTIPDSVISIGYQAFYACPALKEVTVPNSVRSIRDQAFGIIDSEYDYDLEKETLTKTPNFKIRCGQYSAAEEYAKKNGFLCEYVDMPSFIYSELDDGTLELISYTGNDASVTVPKAVNGKAVTSVGYMAFADNKYVKTVTIPSNIKTIGEAAFSGCTSLTSVSLPTGLKELGYSAFNNCTSLSSINIPEGLTEIASNAFAGCTSLKSISLPSTVKVINWYAFGGCTSLEKAVLNEGLEIIAWYAFAGCSKLTEITLPSTITDIYSAFTKSGLKSIHIPASVREFYPQSVNGPALESITIEDSENLPKSYENAVYSRDLTTLLMCPSGRSAITFPAGLKVIGNSSFSSNQNITSLTIPSGVTTIEDYAFSDSENLKYVDIPDSVTNIAEYAFENTSEELTVRCSSGSAAEAFAKAHNIKYVINDTAYKTGDINHDGTVDRIDANLLSRYVAGWDGYDKRIFKDTADLNGDGNVDRIDANILSRCVADWDGYRAKYIK